MLINFKRGKDKQKRKLRTKTLVLTATGIGLTGASLYGLQSLRKIQMEKKLANLKKTQVLLKNIANDQIDTKKHAQDSSIKRMVEGSLQANRNRRKDIARQIKKLTKK